MVERQLPKLNVAGSSPVIRSKEEGYALKRSDTPERFSVSDAGVYPSNAFIGKNTDAVPKSK